MKCRHCTVNPALNGQALKACNHEIGNAVIKIKAEALGMENPVARAEIMEQIKRIEMACKGCARL
jgi:hypothetical protein